MIVNDIATMKKIVTLIVGNDFSKYEPYVREAREWLRTDIVGSALYAKLEDEGNEILLGHAEAVVGNKGYLLGLPFFDLIETEAGFAVTSTGTKAPASAKRVENLKTGLENFLSIAIERLLEYLEETSKYHEDWKGSETFSLLTETYIHKLKDFRRFAQFEGTRLDYKKALPLMLDAIALKIEPVISTELSDQVIEQLRDDDLSDANKTIIRNLRFAFANYYCGNNDKAHSYLMKVKKVITANLDSYTAYRDSALYAAIQATVIEKNNETKPIFRAGF